MNEKLFSLRAPEARVFYNTGNWADKAWSVDFGPGSPEIITGLVKIFAPAYTHFTPEVPDKNEYPRAWLGVSPAQVVVFKDHIEIFPSLYTPTT